MAHTCSLLLYHIVFSTKRREPILDARARELLFPYIAGIIARKDGHAHIVGGVEDHVHILCRLGTTHAVSSVVQAIKSGSTTWYNREAGRARFQWQEEFAAFTVSESQRARVHRYIENQEEHHRGATFAKEYTGLLKRHGVEYDERFYLD